LPLSQRARIEVYLVVNNSAEYKLLLDAIEREFLNSFGGCTVIRGAKGLYLSEAGTLDQDYIDVIYADTPFDPKADLKALSAYTDSLKAALLEATSEESILIVVQEIYHSV
jgi:hypothetical protein